MQLTASGALKSREASMKLGGFSKMWKVGDQGTVYYPVVRDPETGKADLLVAAVWGHHVDMKKLGMKCSFIPTHSKINERGEPVIPDITYQFSRVAKLFLDGEKEKRQAELQAKDWTGLPSSSYKKALEDIENEYDAKTNMNAHKPVIQRLTYLITTECLYVPIENDKPVPDKARVVTQSLSNDRINKLLLLLNKAEFKPAVDENWLEVSYTFTSTNNSKAEAGRVDPVGVTPEYRIKSRFPEQWEELKGRMQSLPNDSNTIQHRNYSYREVPEAAIKQALQTYVLMNQEHLSYLSEEGEDILVRNAAVVKQMQIKIGKEDLREKVQSAIEELPAPVEIPQQETPHMDAYTEGRSAPTIEELMLGHQRAEDNTTEDSEGDDGMSVDL